MRTPAIAFIKQKRIKIEGRQNGPGFGIDRQLARDRARKQLVTYEKLGCRVFFFLNYSPTYFIG